MLAIIPARAGSKGIPGKALRTVAGVPLILRTLRAVEKSGVAERIVVSTDWPELRDFCELRGFETLDRDAALASDDAPLGAVVEDVVRALGWEGMVGVFQPTCPLLEPMTIQATAEAFDLSDADWAITASPDPHIHWRNGAPATPRLNRQQLSDFKCESGAVQLMSAAYALTGKGKQITLPISAREGLDVDTPADLLLAERLAALLRIHFVTAYGRKVGSGHYHRVMHLARVLSHHELSFEWADEEPPDAPARRMPFDAPDVIVFDRLAVPYEALVVAKQTAKVVVLEDEHADSGVLADLRVNELLNRSDLRYAVLREEFCHLPPRSHRKDAKRVLVTFGGTDPARLTDRVVSDLNSATWDLDVLRPGEGRGMARAMREADLVVTGQGRTVLEAAATETPCVSLAANEREARHIRIPGVCYLGLHSTVPHGTLIHTVNETLGSQELREEMADTARNNFDDRGADRLAAAIEGLCL